MPSSPFSSTLLHRLAQARCVGVLTGAGISAESGIPTFRDPGGLWERYRPEDLANVPAFLERPALVQGWYAYRRNLARHAAPNAGHQALVALEQATPAFTLVTQNVDDLHRRAGSRNVIELHGNLFHSYCIACDTPAETPEAVEAAGTDEVLRCRACNGLIRPGVVWFGESLPADALEAAIQAARQADVFLSIGTSGVVYPAAALPLMAREHGAYVVEINVTPTAIADGMDEVLLGKAGEVLPALVQAVWRSY